MENIIPTEVAKTLDGLFNERVRRSSQMVAYRSYDQVAGNWRYFQGIRGFPILPRTRHATKKRRPDFKIIRKINFYKIN